MKLTPSAAFPRRAALRARAFPTCIGFLLITCLAALSAGAATPEAYQWRRLPVGGGGAITSLALHPLVQDVAYIGADVGGLDRWDASTESWTQTLSFSWAERNLYGVESIAIDPSDSTGNTLYASVGTFAYTDRLKGEVIKSNDRGATWVRSAHSSAKVWVASNWEQTRTQRLAVDPANAQILYHGSREGLRISTDGGVLWATVAGAPPGGRSSLNTGGASGIRAVLIDPSAGTVENPRRTARLYVGPEGGTVSVSNDGGSTWAALPGAPTSVNRMAAAADGTLFVATANGLFRYDGATWTNISPEAGFAYAALALDPARPGRIVTSTHRYQLLSGRIYYSNSSGAPGTWVNAVQNESATFVPPWYKIDHRRSSIFQVAIDPFRQEDASGQARLWYTDWYMPWRTENYRAAATEWTSFTDGHEELVTLALASPSSGPVRLYTGVADEGGFAHADLETTPQKNLWGLGLQTSVNLSGIDYQETNPLFAAFSGTIGWEGEGRGGYTLDGAQTVRNFATLPFSGAKAGRIAISSLSGRIVWGTSGGTYYSDTLGDSWTQATGLPSGVGSSDLFNANQRLAADRFNDNVYALVGGRFYRSGDGGATFAQVSSGWPNPSGGFVRIFVSPVNANEVWAYAENGSQLLRSVDAGATFTALPDIQQVITASMGKGPHPNVASLYLMGKVDGESEACFRSDDYGATWKRIGDLSQPYPGNVPKLAVGDRREWGRFFTATSIGVYVADPLALPAAGEPPVFPPLDNIPPAISLIAPGNGAVLFLGSNLELQANANDADGSLARVEFYMGPTKIAEDTSAPYAYTLFAPPAGSYAFSAVAVDDAGASRTSATSNVTVAAVGAPVLYEAENASLSGGSVSTQFAGYTGSGFVDYPSGSGYVQFAVTAPYTGSYTLLFTYANGGTTPRTGTVAVNGGGNLALSFASQPNWTTWAGVGLTVTLNAGTNTVRMTSSSNGPNLDHLVVTAVKPQVSSFTPSSGAVGTTVVLTGQGLLGATAVKFFNGKTAAFTVDSPTQITAVVPAGAISGTIRVETPSGAAATRTKFTVAP